MKTVEFPTYPEACGCDAISLRGVMKQFPDVEEIKIGSLVTSIEMSNFMFPNVKKVYSQSLSFINDCSCLMTRTSLCNAFCKGSDETIDMKDIDTVAPWALEGCNARLISSNGLFIQTEDAVKGYDLKPMEYGSVTCIGNTVIRVDDGDDLVIPDNVRKICDFVGMIGKKSIKINAKSIDALLSCMVVRGGGCSTDSLEIAFNDSFAEREKIVRIIERGNGLLLTSISISENPYVKSVDGILYSKDGKKLLYCPLLRNGKVVVPDGVEEIAANAFCGCRINAVEIPESVEIVGRCAFSGCGNLESVDLNNVEIVESEAFSLCGNLRSVDLGRKLKSIGFQAFLQCPKLKELSFPATVRYTEPEICPSLKKVYLHGDNIPRGFFSALCTEASHPDNPEKYLEVETYAGKHYFIPRVIRHGCSSKMDDALNVFGNFNDNLDFSFQYAASNEVKYRCATKSYQANHNPELAKYLSRVASAAVVGLFENEDYLIDFLSLGLANENTLKNTLKGVRQEYYEKAEAYILNLLNNSKSKSFRL